MATSHQAWASTPNGANGNSRLAGTGPMHGSEPQPDDGFVDSGQCASVGRKRGPIVIIEFRFLLRECLSRALAGIDGHPTIARPNVGDWMSMAAEITPAAILLGIGGSPQRAGIDQEIAALKDVHKFTPIILICDSETPEEIMWAYGLGVRGFIPTSLPLSVAVQAIRLVLAGGEYVPPRNLVAMQHPHSWKMAIAYKKYDNFTPRQIAIVHALCRGKPNKTIAHELNVCESTVKVHVRNIMRKLKARNRTEVAMRVQDFFAS